jgi:hypothetical protein
MAVVTAARAAHEVLSSARRTPAQDDLRELRHALLALVPTAPGEYHLDIVTVHDCLDVAAQALEAARRDFTARRAALRTLDHVLADAERIILALDPTAATPLQLEDLPATADDITVSTLAYNTPHPDDRPEDAAPTRGGTPVVRVTCRSDSKLGRRITAVITTGVESGGRFWPAHPPVARSFHRRDGRLSAAETARRALAARLAFIAAPVRWIDDRRP